MKSELKESENMDTKERVYPYIGKFTNDRDSEDYVCVLFTGEYKGMAIFCSSGSVYSVGYYSTTWMESYFEVLPSTSQIILQND